MKSFDLNRQIIQIWKDFPTEHNGLSPELVNDIADESILFVGLNPAFNRKWIGKLLQNNGKSEIDPEKYFSWNEMINRSEDINFLINYQSLSSDTEYQYFRKFTNIAKKLNHNWQHIDLFYYRETNQKKLITKILSKGELNNFGLRQLQISAQVMRLSKPAVIVVVNAFSSMIIRNNYQRIGFDSLVFDEQKGFHFLGAGKIQIPIFFTGMITGQRALDLGSLERLEWHIKQSLNQSFLTT